MNVQRLAARADDPRVVATLVVASASLALWLAAWSGIGHADFGAICLAGGLSEPPSGKIFLGDRWSLAAVANTASMWLLMMAAMMLPSMAPIAAIYTGVASREDAGLRLAARVALFLLGHLTLWGGFSLVMALVQFAARGSPWFTLDGTQAVPLTGGLLLLVAGAWQFSSIREACLRHCRHPLGFLLQNWREGLGGAFPLGLRHGLHCFGCCVAMMGLMFLFGAMNVWWMAVLAVYFLAEKMLPRVDLWGPAIGVVLLVSGAATVAVELM